MKNKQIYIGFIIIALSIIFAISKGSVDNKLALYLISGLAVGYVLQRSRFGFAGSVRKPAMMGNGKLVRALLMLFTITTIVTATIHYVAVANGAEVIPGMSSVKPVTLGLFIGGTLFGIGMILAGCCASGSLTDIGEGAGRAIIVLIFFTIGSVLGVWHLGSLKNTFLYEKSITMYLPDYFGYVGAVLLSLLAFLAIYIFINKYQTKRKAEGTFVEETYNEWEKDTQDYTNYKFFSKETYHTFFVKRWSFMAGAIGMAILFIVILLTTNKSWGVTSTFTDWGVWLLGLVGVDFSNIEALKSSVETVNNGLLNSASTLRNLGIIIGALVCMLLASKFKFIYKYRFKDVVVYIFAGLIMGYGARLASGCNAGALLGGISNLSLSGWVFLVAMVLGGVIGVKIVKKYKFQI